jgi:hypothetical protein
MMGWFFCFGSVARKYIIERMYDRTKLLTSRLECKGEKNED